MHACNQYKGFTLGCIDVSSLITASQVSGLREG